MGVGGWGAHIRLLRPRDLGGQGGARGIVVVHPSRHKKRGLSYNCIGDCVNIYFEIDNTNTNTSHDVTKGPVPCGRVKHIVPIHSVLNQLHFHMVISLPRSRYANRREPSHLGREGGGDRGQYLRIVSSLSHYSS